MQESIREITINWIRIINELKKQNYYHFLFFCNNKDARQHQVKLVGWFCMELTSVLSRRAVILAGAQRYRPLCICRFIMISLTLLSRSGMSVSRTSSVYRQS